MNDPLFQRLGGVWAGMLWVVMLGFFLFVKVSRAQESGEMVHVESPPTVVEEPPVVAPEPPPVKTPPPPRVDPDLRKMYLRGSGIGSAAGPHALRKPKRDRPGGPWRSELEAGASGYRGNTDSELLLLRFKTARKREHDTLGFGARAYIGNKDGERDRENAEADVAYRRTIRDQWYATTEVRYFTDKLADLDYQVVAVLSPGYDFVRTDTAHLSLEIGPAYIAEKKGDEEKDFAAARIALMMDRLIDERILVWERFEYLPAIDDTRVYLLIAELGAESILTDWFRLRTTLRLRYDSDPADGKEQEDLFLSVSVVTVF